ncbi:hypothetical protein DID78_05520 [Candidatus Marinamargulisbacteria bacterium SCGC AG-343-D04]|nr:hypothetical protein DID78_05520 [Candidatus Marinamargulisbacteria bacterium SCGC AG-343-D04]
MINKDSIELIIEKQSGNTFKATTPSFPICKGIGETKDDAINKLCNSITYFISKTTKHFLKTKLLSKDYSEIVVNPEKKEDFQHRVIPLMNSSTQTNHKQVFLKSIESLFDSYISGTSHSENPTESALDSIESLFNQTQPSSKEPDNLMFGINLCLN